MLARQHRRRGTGRPDTNLSLNILMISILSINNLSLYNLIKNILSRTVLHLKKDKKIPLSREMLVPANLSFVRGPCDL
jgi:hypothetical protein